MLQFGFDRVEQRALEANTARSAKRRRLDSREGPQIRRPPVLACLLPR